jgi:hypothetical protein
MLLGSNLNFEDILCGYEMWPFKFREKYQLRGPGSSVGILTGYEMDGPGIESRCWRDIPHLSRPALRPNAASCTIGTGFFPGLDSGRGVTLTPHPLLVPRSKNRVELYLCSP